MAGNIVNEKCIESVFIHPVITPHPAETRGIEPGLPVRWNAGLTVHFDQ